MSSELETAREEFKDVYMQYVRLQKGTWTEEDEVGLQKEMKRIERLAWIEAVAVGIIVGAVFISTLVITTCIALKLWF